MKLPFFDELEKSHIILLAGAGGGFDIFSGLPIYSWLKQRGKTVHLANLSFTDFSYCNADHPTPALWQVLPGTEGSSNYFPELYLSQWLSKPHEVIPVYALERTGAKPILEAYQWMVQMLKPDTLILIDGGTDILMQGDEIGLGTPQEDMSSLYAANSVDIERKFVGCLGFGVDTFHGVSHARFLENVASLARDKSYLGAWSLLESMDEFQFYNQAYKYTVSKMPQAPSIVTTSITSAVEGRFGDYHATTRTLDSKLFINPLMSLYWTFQLEAVATKNLYLDRIGNTSTFQELSLAIESFHSKLPHHRPWIDLPF